MSRPKSRRELYSEATRAALLETATAMFTERGYAGTSLDDIATATQVTRGAVYHHFASKLALFEAVYEALEERMTQQIAAAGAPFADPWDAGIAGINEFLDRCVEEDYARLCWLEGPIALGWNRWLEREKKHAYALIEAFVTANQASGKLAPVSAPIASELAFHLLGGAGRMLAEAPAAQRPEVRAECGAVILRMISGMRADAG